MPDFSALAQLHARCFETPRPWSAAEIESLLKASGSFLLKESAGFLIGRAIAGEAELLTLAVAPEARRQGLGNKLLLRFFAESVAKGAESAFLEVSAENIAALALYDSVGFAKVGQRKRYYLAPDGRQIDAIVMSRPF